MLAPLRALRIPGPHRGPGPRQPFTGHFVGTGGLLRRPFSGPLTGSLSSTRPRGLKGHRTSPVGLLPRAHGVDGPAA